MAIPESQLITWSHQGAVVGSKDTYAAIKRALESSNANYTSRNFEVFLQGSYGNDTNIFAESDVDVVIRHNGVFYHDIINDLPANQQSAFNSYFSDGTYPYSSFKGHVQAALEAAFGRSVKPGKKAIKVEANGSRRSADVVVAFEYRRYYKFNGVYDQSYDTGIAFFASDGTRIVNYPKHHSTNCTTKHQATSNNFKPLVRILKNMRGRLIDNRLIEDGSAPSYFIEGLLYNVPNQHFYGSYENAVLNVLRWLRQTSERTNFVCANEQHYLLRDGHTICWPCADGERFINAAVRLWDNWVR